MAQASGTLGSRLFISTVTIASTIDSEPEFTNLSYQEIGLISTFGEFGRVFDVVTFQAVADGRTFKLKGGFNDGNFQFTVGQDLSDAGQLAFKTGAEGSNQNNYAFRIELNDAVGVGGGPSIFFFRGLPTSFRTQMGAANAVITAACSIEVNGDIIYAPAAEIWDRFVTGGSLAQWALFKGSDAQALLPVITANALVSVTGDTGTNFAADGSEAINVTGFTLNASTGNVVAEALLKISAITNAYFYFGLTDQKVALEAPIESAASADTLTSNATDAVGFMFDTSMATDNIWLVGVNNDVDKTAQNSAIAPVADTYLNLRIILSAAGTATFYINGVAIGTTMTTAVRTTVPLYPVLAASARSTASRTMTTDYAYARQD